MRAGARNSRFQTRTAYMLVLDIDYRPQYVAHAHQVRDLHSMVGRLLRTTSYRYGYRGGGPCARFGRLNGSVWPRGRNVITCGEVCVVHIVPISYTEIYL